MGGVLPDTEVFGLPDTEVFGLLPPLGLGVKESSLWSKPGEGFAGRGERWASLPAGDGHTRAVFVTLPVLPELLKPSVWFLLSLTRLIMFAQPLCRLCSPGERAARQRNNAGSTAAWVSVQRRNPCLVASIHPFSWCYPKSCSGQICLVLSRGLGFGV